MTSEKLALNHRRSGVFYSPQDVRTGLPMIGNMSQTMGSLVLALLVWSSSTLGYALQTVDSLRNEDQSPDHIVTGTLDQLDFDNGKGLLRTDLGKPVFFDMALPDIFRRLSIGQRVTIGINDQGQATKVMEIPPVELPSSELPPPRK